MNYVRLAFATLALLGLVGTYGALSRMFELNADDTDGLARSETNETIRALAYRAIGFLAILAVGILLLFPPINTPHIGGVLLAGGLKATHWIAVLWLV